MPVMLRKKGKATRIAFAIMGVPQNMGKQKPARKAAIDKRLVFEETTRVK